MQYVARVETMPREPKYFPPVDVDSIVLQVHCVVDNALLGDAQCTLKIGRISFCFSHRPKAFSPWMINRLVFELPDAVSTHSARFELWLTCH